MWSTNVYRRRACGASNSRYCDVLGSHNNPNRSILTPNCDSHTISYNKEYGVHPFGCICVTDQMVAHWTTTQIVNVVYGQWMGGEQRWELATYDCQVVDAVDCGDCAFCQRRGELHDHTSVA